MFSAIWLLQMACVGHFHLKWTMAFIWMKSVILIVKTENSLLISCVLSETLVVLYLVMLLASWQSCWTVELISLRSIYRLSRILQVCPTKPIVSDVQMHYVSRVLSFTIKTSKALSSRLHWIDYLNSEPASHLKNAILNWLFEYWTR